jgi:4-amino-4-deoxy-L-arabinose transferase-like glycosyltransferase
MTVHRALVAFIIVASGYLCLARLDSPALWDDEAHVAIFARNFLKTGSWSAWDGRNIIVDRNGAYLDANLDHRMPQLDYVMTAVSFRIFGVSTWSSRLPFALAGCVALLFFWRLMKVEFRATGALELYALSALAFSTNFLLNVRTCRYYAFSILLTVAICYCYSRFLQTRRFVFAAGIAIGAILMFVTSALNCGALLFALAVRHAVFHLRTLTWRGSGKLALSACIFLILAVPYAVWYVVPFSEAARIDMMLSGLPKESRLMSGMTKFLWNLREINMMNAVPWTIAGLLGYLLFVNTKDSESVVAPAREWAVMIVAFSLFTGFFSPQPVWVTRMADVRYLSAILPLFAGLVAVGIWFIHRYSPAIGVAILAVYLSCNILAIEFWNPQWRWRWLFPAFLAEVHRPYPTSCSEVVKFLSDRTNQDEVVWVSPDYMTKPLVLYVGDKLRFAWALDPRTPLPADKLRELNVPVFRDRYFPQWVIAFGAQPQVVENLQFFSRPHEENGNKIRFSYRAVAMLNVYWAQTQRPELPWHSFGPRRNFNPEAEAVYIFKRGEPAIAAEGVL